MPVDMEIEETIEIAGESSIDKLERFREDIIYDAEPMDEQRDAAEEDLRFINVDGGMWEGYLDDEQNLERARLELDLISDFLYRTYGDWTLNRVGVEYKPSDKKTTMDDATMLNGIYRANFRDNSGKVATDNAVLETMTSGYGAFKLATIFEDPEDPENEKQNIEWRPIHNAFNSVFWDLSAKRIDKLDARRCSELTEYTKDAFEDAYPGKDPISAYTPESRRRLNNYTSITEDSIFVATRYDVVKKRQKVFVYNNFVTGQVEIYRKEEHDEIKKELSRDVTREFIRERPMIIQHVEKSVFSGVDVFTESEKIPGKWIPIIPVYGYRAFVSGSERYRGVVRKLKDASRLFNTQMSQMAETSSSSGQDTPFFDPDQMPDEFDQAWADKNNASWLPVKALRDDDGKIIHQGPLGYDKPPALDGASKALMQTVPQYIQQITGGAPQETLNPKTSGKAINAILRRVNLNVQPIFDNIANSIAGSGVVFQAMAAEIFNESRILRVLSREGIDSTIEIKKVVSDQETGLPIHINSLEDKRFHAYADTSPQYDSLQEQTVEDMMNLMEVVKGTKMEEQFMPILFSVMISNVAGPGTQQLKDVARRNLLIQGLVKPETPEEQKLVQEAKQQTNPQEELFKAAAEEAKANAAESLAEVKKTDSEVIENLSSAEKTRAETLKIEADIRNDQIKTMSEAEARRSKSENDKVKTRADIRKQVFDTAKELSLN